MNRAYIVFSDGVNAPAASAMRDLTPCGLPSCRRSGTALKSLDSSVDNSVAVGSLGHQQVSTSFYGLTATSFNCKELKISCICSLRPAPFAAGCLRVQIPMWTVLRSSDPEGPGPEGDKKNRHRRSVTCSGAVSTPTARAVWLRSGP